MDDTAVETSAPMAAQAADGTVGGGTGGSKSDGLRSDRTGRIDRNSNNSDGGKADCMAAAAAGPEAPTRTSDRLARLQIATAALSGSLTLSQVAEVIVTQAVCAFEAHAGLLALLSDTGDTLGVVRQQGFSEEGIALWRRLSLDIPSPLSDAVRQRELVFVESYEELASRYPAFVQMGIDCGLTPDGHESCAAIPLADDNRLKGVVGLIFDADRRFGADDRAFLMSLARQCAYALERAQLYDDAERARLNAEAERSRLAFLAEASAVLASSLDYRATLASVADLAIPRLADWCFVSLLSEDGEAAETVVVVHSDPEKVAQAQEFLRKYPPNLKADQGLGRVLRTGKMDFVPEITDEHLVATARSEEYLAASRLVGLASRLSVPLNARGHTLGAITLLTTRESERRFTQQDVDLARELASRAALAVDNARLYAEAQTERATAENVLESITDAFFALDGDWRFTYINRRAEVYLGRSRTELIGTPYWDLLRAARGSVFERQYRRVMRERAPVDFEAFSPFSERWLEVRAYPAAGNGISVYFRDITEQHEAAEERRAATRNRRAFVKDVLASVTEGRLQLCYDPSELPRPLPPCAEPQELSAPTLRRLRAATETAADQLGFSHERTSDLVTAVSEAAMNAVRHAGGGLARVCGTGDRMQVWVVDEGAGIDMERLPRATLQPGYSSAGSLGHGFWLILQTADRVWMLTGPAGTTVVLEQDRVGKNVPAWLSVH